MYMSMTVDGQPGKCNDIAFDFLPGNSQPMLDFECDYASTPTDNTILSSFLSGVNKFSDYQYNMDQTSYSAGGGFNNNFKIFRPQQISGHSVITNGSNTTTFTYGPQTVTPWVYTHVCNYTGSNFPTKQYKTPSNPNPSCTGLKQCNAPFSKIVAISFSEAQVLTCNGSNYSVNTIADNVCLGNFHMENGICVDNVKQCDSGDTIPEGVSVAYKYWNGTSYSSCIADGYNCSSGNHPESFLDTVSCVSDSQSCTVFQGTGTQNWDPVNGWSGCSISGCGTNFHLETVDNISSCQSNTKSCLDQNSILWANGATQTWNGEGYGVCTATSCVSTAHLNNGSCDLNTISCVGEINNSLAATKTWNGTQYGACSVNECQEGFDLLNNSCLSGCTTGTHRNISSYACDNDTITCSVSNGIGSQSWTGTGYGSCQLVSCNNGYTNVGGNCINSQNCSVAHGSGTQSWETTAWGPCQVQNCDTGYHSETNSCIDNVQDCTGEINHAVSAHKSWEGSSYGLCLLGANGCQSDFHNSGDNLSCLNNIQDCTSQIAHAANAAQTWNGNEYGTCTLVSCNTGYSPNGESCSSNLSIATLSNKTTFGGGDTDSIQFSGGVSPITYSVSGALQSVVSIDNTGVFIVSYETGNDKFGYLEVVDGDGNSKTINLTIKAQFSQCTPNTTSYPGATAGTKEWTGTAYGSCDTITACNTLGYNATVHNNACCQLYKACDYQGAHTSTDNINDLVSENLTAEGVGFILNNVYKIKTSVRGLEKLDENSWTYSTCYAHKCESNYHPYPIDFSNPTATCEFNVRSCTETEVAALPSAIENGNYINEFNDIGDEFWSNCHLDLTSATSRCKTIAGKTVEYRDFGTKEFCAACDDGKKAVFISSGSPITYSYTCETKQDKCNDNGVYTGTAMSDRISSTACHDEPRGLSGKIDQYGNPVQENTAYRFKSLPENLYPNAKCFDGSRGGFLYRKGKGSGANRWVIVLQGGGACGTVDSDPTNLDPNNQFNVCQMAQGVLVDINHSNNQDLYNRFSNKDFLSNEFSFFAEDSSFNNPNFNNSILMISPLQDYNLIQGKIGILSGDKNVNPDFYTWNQVLIRYCSQDLWSGAGGSFVGNTSNQTYYFNGYNILSATFDYLKNH
jgi:hypothetical protein